MKDIDTLLFEQTPKPKRELQAQFTQTVMSEIKSGHSGVRDKHRRNFLSRLRTVPGVIALAVLLAGSGLSAYAATAGWFGNTGGATVTTTPSNPTIVTVNLGRCVIPWISNPNPTFTYGQKIQITGPTKFKILQPKKVTAAEVRTEILSYCEQEAVLGFYNKTYPSWWSEANTEVLYNWPAPYAPYFGKIKQVERNQVTVQFPASGKTITATYPVTKTLTVYKNGNNIPLGNLRAGDNALFIIKQSDTVNYNSPSYQPTPPEPNNSTLVSISQTEYDDADVNAYEVTNSQVFEPLSVYNLQQAVLKTTNFYRTRYPQSITSTAYMQFFGTVTAVKGQAITMTIPWDDVSGWHDISPTLSTKSTTIFQNGKNIPLGSLHAGDQAFFLIDIPYNARPYTSRVAPSDTNAKLVSITKYQ